MTDAIVTQLHPPSPAALKQRRYRACRRAVTQSVTPSVTVVAPKAKPSVTHHVPWSVWPLAGTTVGLMAVSLTHLSDGVIELTSIPTWQGWAMAAGIDCLLISVALAQLTAAPDVKRDIRRWRAAWKPAPWS